MVLGGAGETSQNREIMLGDEKSHRCGKQINKLQDNTTGKKIIQNAFTQWEGETWNCNAERDLGMLVERKLDTRLQCDMAAKRVP